LNPVLLLWQNIEAINNKYQPAYSSSGYQESIESNLSRAGQILMTAVNPMIIVMF
jgi:hypothetical protein